MSPDVEAAKSRLSDKGGRRMNYRVLDISAYQGEVDFAKGKSDGIWGVMLKATEGE